MTAFVGIDLAWGAKNDSGVCVASEDGCRFRCAPDTPAQLGKLLDELGEDVVVGIDAPLIVEPGRTAERMLARRMGRAGVFAHSATAAIANHRDRGIQLAAVLRGLGFRLDPVMEARAPGRFAFEVYPHAGHVVMFQLSCLLKYKQKPRRTSADLNVALADYRELLRCCLETEWPELARDSAVSTLLDQGYLRGAARKRHEDTLDALSCALMARLAWRDGIDAGDVLGDHRGYILVPGLGRDPRFPPAGQRPRTPGDNQ